MGVALDGSVYVYWIDTRHMKKEGDNSTIYGVVSRDEGKSFEHERMIFANLACPCCQLWVAFSPEAKPYLSFRAVGSDGSRDSLVAWSEDRGKTFSQPVRVASSRWLINACPLKPTVIAIDQQGRVFAAYYTAGEQPAGVYFTVSDNDGKTFTKSVAIHPEAKVSDHPSVAVGPDGVVYVAWDAKVGDGRRVYLRVSSDHGKTFGPIREFGDPSGSATYPAVAVDKNGRVYLAYQQNDRVVVESHPSLVTKIK